MRVVKKKKDPMNVRFDLLIQIYHLTSSQNENSSCRNANNMCCLEHLYQCFWMCNNRGGTTYTKLMRKLVHGTAWINRSNSAPELVARPYTSTIVYVVGRHETDHGSDRVWQI